MNGHVDGHDKVSVVVRVIILRQVSYIGRIINTGPCPKLRATVRHL